MKKIFLFVTVFAAIFASCSKETDLYEGETTQDQPETVADPDSDEATDPDSDEAILEHMRSIFGADFDVESGWNMIQSGSVEIVADAKFATAVDYPAATVAKVQVLTANPFTTDVPTVLNEIAATYGQKYTLYYDAPQSIDTLYAACVSNNGQYRVKPFAVGTPSVSFSSTTASKARRRVEVAAPTIANDGELSWNAKNVERATESNAYKLWYGKDWTDKLYDINATIEDIDNFTSTELKDFNGYREAAVPEYSDNRNRVKLSTIYVNSANYMTSTGTQQTITVTPLFVGGTYWPEYRLYYYYFNPANTAGMSKEDKVKYLESLPKFKLLDQRVEANKVFTGWPQTKRSKRFTLAYFGEGEPTNGQSGTYEFPQGLYIGFMLQHLQNNDNHINNGEFYGDSLLNNEVNYFGDAAKAYMGDDATRAAIFGANGSNYISFEDKSDNDFNDIIFEVEGGVEIVDPHYELDKNVYTYAFEDRKKGDYDLNDVVVKAQRVDKTHVKYSLEACGADDELYLRGDVLNNANVLKKNIEIHEFFNQKAGPNQHINTVESNPHFAAVQDTIEVSETFSFANPNFEIWIYNKTANYEVKIARAGQDPHGILIPWDFQYPREQICVKDAYKKFNNWGSNRHDDTDWYKYPVNEKYYTKSQFK
mgnify:CR=1 FL=1